MPIEQHAPGLTRIVDLNQKIEELASGLGGERGPAEGPVWWQEGGYLLGRVGTPEDVAYGVLYLASEESAFVTGLELVIDGGRTAQ